MDVLKVQERSDAKPHQLRRNGITPIGLVQRGLPTRKMQAPTAMLKEALSNAQGIGILEVQVEGETGKRTVFVKQIDKIPHTTNILNVTLNEVTKDELMTAEVQVTSVGTPDEVARGSGVLVASTSTIRLKGKHTDLPSTIEVDISHLEVGGSIHAGAIVLPPGTELASSPDTTLFSVTHLRAAEPEPEPVVTEAAAPVTEEPAG